MFDKHLSKEAKERLRWWQKQVDEVRTLNDKELAAVAENTFRNAAFPHSRHVLRGQPVYDSVLWHVIVPELIRRLRERRDEAPPGGR